MNEIICVANYTDGKCSYQVEREISEKEITISIFEIYKGRHYEKNTIKYKNVGEEYATPFLSWYNLIFCSNNYGAPPDYEYMHRAVQENKKTAATVYIASNSDEAKAFVETLPKECGALPYGPSMIYVYHKGRLSDYFDFERIQALYEKHGVFDVDWKKVWEYFRKDLSYFGKEKYCGFSLQSGGVREQMIVTGLILGYPVESTIAFLGYK